MVQHDSGDVPVDYTGPLPTGVIPAKAGLASEFTYMPGECPRRSPGRSPATTDRTGIADGPPGLYPDNAPR